LAKKKGKIDLGEKLKPVAKEVKEEEPEEQLEQPPMGLMSRREQ
jgi:hypothetical protein